MANQDRQIGPPPRWGEHRSPATPGQPCGGPSRRALERQPLPCRLSPLAGTASAAHQNVAISCGVLVGLLVLGCAGLWWRLSTGPIQVDAFSPWLVAAIEENFGSRERVEVGGTQIERTANGGAAVRVRDIVVRDPDGSVVASAPKAEIRVSGMSLLSGHMRAESLSLVGAELAVRIEQDGNITVFASSADKHPIARASAPLVGAALGSASLPSQDNRAIDKPAAATILPGNSAPARAAAPPPAAADSIAAVLAWLDGIGQSGLDGHDLRELGLKDGTLTVDDQRTGKRWSFHDITMSLERPRGGGITVTIGSENPEHPWGRPLRSSRRPTAIAVLRSKLAKWRPMIFCWPPGLMMAHCKLIFRFRRACAARSAATAYRRRWLVASSPMQARSATVKAAMVGSRSIAEFKINWDAASRLLSVPFQIVSGKQSLHFARASRSACATPGVLGI